MRSLKRMETKIIKKATKEMLKEFIYRSFMPNDININFKNIFYKSLDGLNQKLLLNDLRKLYSDRNSPEFSNKDCKVIFIKSENDLVLDKDSNNNFFELLSKKLHNKPILIKLTNQGHCLTNLNLYQTIIKKL